MKTYTKLNKPTDIFKTGKCSIETMELYGFELIEKLFCDCSGLGADNEPALTSDQATCKVLNIIDNNDCQLYCSITEQGQFQVYVGIFKKIKKPNTTKINQHVSKRIEDGKTIIRLYDTDILTIGNNYIIINYGSHQTPTTKKWINEFLPTGQVYQKNYEWFYNDKPVVNGAIINLTGGTK